MLKEFILPELGEKITAGDVVKINVSVGDLVAKDQLVLELETDKAVVEVPAFFAGTVREIKVKVGDKAKVGQVVMVLDVDGQSVVGTGAPCLDARARLIEPVKDIISPSPPLVVKSAPVAPVPMIHSSGDPLILAAPSVRKLARAMSVDLKQVALARQGRYVTADDVKDFAQGAASSQQPELPDFSKWGTIERVPMTAVRRKTASHLSQSWNLIPHVTQFEKADMTALEALRNQFAKRAEEAGGKLTHTVIMLKILAAALKQFPQFNVSVDGARDEIIQKKYHHIGVAVDTDRGLLVPVIRDVDKKNIIQLSVEITKMAERARSKKTTLDEMQGGTFTITNLGGLGGTYFTPIVNHPEVAILGLSRSQMEPVYENGKFEPRFMMPMSLSYDHRVIDGADAVRFLKWITEAMKQPFLMNLEGNKRV